MIYFVIILSLILFLWLPVNSAIAYGVSVDRLANCLCYMYMHASWLHLAINTLSLFLLWPPVRRLYIMRYNTHTHFLSGATYLSAILAGAFCATATPTVGMSGMVFFLLGALLALNPIKQQLINYVWVFLAVLVQVFFGHSNVPLHLFAFAEGALYICIREFLYQYKTHTGVFQC